MMTELNTVEMPWVAGVDATFTFGSRETTTPLLYGCKSCAGIVSGERRVKKAARIREQDFAID
jgi:hypothetical protein